MKFPNYKTLWFILTELFSYAAAGVLGFYIGCLGGIAILFGLGLQHPNTQVPVWLGFVTWLVYIVPIILCIVGRYLLTTRRNRKQQREYE